MLVIYEACHLEAWVIGVVLGQPFHSVILRIRGEQLKGWYGRIISTHRNDGVHW